MQPTRDRECTITDLLNRVLDKGAIIIADVVITLGGVPLIGVNLKAVIAGMQTMLDQGLMEEWDKEIRSNHGEEALEGESEEKVMAGFVGSYCKKRGPIRAWKSGRICVTDKNLALLQIGEKQPDVIIALSEIRQVSLVNISSFIGVPLQGLVVSTNSAGSWLMKTADVSALGRLINREAQLPGDFSNQQGGLIANA